jgi:transketolase
MKLNTHLHRHALKPKRSEAVPTRDGFGEGLREAGERDARVVALCADLTDSTRVAKFRDAFPERFIEMGIGEQSMASVASGLAAMGKVPFIASYAMFSPGRNWEQIRTTVAYNDANVKIVGAHAGVSVGPDGATHQAIEDIALMRVIPRMTVIVPADAEEAKRATLAAAAHDGPVYIRLGREATPVVTTPNSPFAIGRAEVIATRNPKYERTVGIIVSGTLLQHALLAAQALERQKIGVSVMNLATVKPLDETALLAFAEEHSALVTVEEHQIAGGMGSAVAECLAELHPVPITRIGVRDQFGQSGTPEELISFYGMDASAIAAAAEHLIA